MVEVIWTEPTLAELDAIGDHIALDDYDAACKLIRNVFKKEDLPERNPDIGNVPQDLRNTPYRRLLIPPVYVYYRKKEEKIIIIISADLPQREFNQLTTKQDDSFE